MSVAECFPSALIDAVFERLTSPDLLNFGRKERIHSKLKEWRKTLSKIQAVLRDAEEKQTVDEAVKMWLNDLQDLAYDLDDVLDELYTQDLRIKVMTSRPQAKVLKFIISTWTANFSTRARKIDDISSRLENIWRLKNVLHLNENCGWRGIKPYETMKRFRTTTSLVDESCVYGREVAKDAILELLSRGDDEVSVIPIVGMGGVGKTTLAQLVYHDDKNNMRFDVKVWACVSDGFDVVAVTKLMLKSLTFEACTLNDLNSLQVKLRDNLFRKKYLIVLDDIWNENYADWDLLRRPLLSGARGSKIIVTTRNQSVAAIMGTVPAYRLEVLAKEDSIQLLAQWALGISNFDEHQDLKEVGEEIVRKCQGLPLAIKTLGGVLRFRQRPSEWEDVLNSKIWEFSEGVSGILPVLHLSYHDLPSHLKQCFAYCSIFPRDYEFDKEELTLLWMAVGLLRLSKGTKKSVEDIGGEYFDDLLSRSIFQHSGRNALRFVMHDLMSDLAQFVAGEICFRLEAKSEGKLSERTRHLSYNHKEFEAFQKHKDFYKIQRIRTFLLFPYPNHLYDFDLSTKVLVDLLSRLQYVRVLSLSGYFMRELPSSIGELKHLRYLNFSHTSIKCLPDSLCTLYNLQTLSLHGCRSLCDLPTSIGDLVNLRNLNLSRTSVKCLPDSVCTLYNLETLSLDGCRSLCELPTSIGDLVNLRHLDNANTEELQEMPLGIGKVTNLQTLPKIGLGKSSGLKLQELKDLQFLRGMLSIVGLQNVVNIDDAKEASLSCKHYLDELALVWCCTFDDSRDEKLEMDVLDMLRPQIMLKKLEIEFYGGLKFPSWIGDPSFSEIVKISLIDCRKCTSLPPLGQLPMLKYLSIGGLHEVRRVGGEFYRDGCPLEFQSFVSLETLSFEDMPEWEEWSYFIGGTEVGGQFPRLSKLTISSCPKLTRIPLLQLISLRNLYLEECPGVVLKRFADLTSLITLKIVRVTDLTCLHEEFLRFSVALEDTEVSGCNELESLWQNGPVTLENHVHLKELRVLNCPQLVSLGEEEQGLPPNLEILRLSRCDNLEKLPNGLNSRTSLRTFIIDCPKLMSFPGGVFR